MTNTITPETTVETLVAQALQALTINNGTKYRMHVRTIAASNGWTVAPGASPRTDHFQKGDTVVAVHHGPKDLLTSAEVVSGGHYDTIAAKSDRKWFKVAHLLTGDPASLKTYFKVGTKELQAMAETLVWLQGVALWDWTQAEQAWQDSQAPEQAPEPQEQDTKPAPKPRAKRVPKPQA